MQTLQEDVVQVLRQMLARMGGGGGREKVGCGGDDGGSANADSSSGCPVVFIGHSLGGAIAVGVVAKRSLPNVRGLALIEACEVAKRQRRRLN